MFLSVAFVLAATIYGGASMPIDKESLALNGRWSVQESCLCASAPAASVAFRAVTGGITFDIEGEARFLFEIDGKPSKYVTVNGRKKEKFATPKDNKPHAYRLIKVSESNPGKICIYDIDLGKKGSFAEKPKTSSRRIEFIGDSFTVGYGVEGKNVDDGTPFEKTNASKSYAFLLAEGYRADYQVNAVSGRGLVRNYANIVPEWTLETLYDYTMMGVPEQDSSTERWDFDKFHPQVVVVFVGINDFQGEPPYADADKFKAAYAKLLDRLRALHPGVKFLLVSTKTWPNDALTPVVEDIYKSQTEAGHNDLMYKVVYTDNTALHGHPNEMSQKELANTLRPLVGRLGGWLSR